MKYLFFLFFISFSATGLELEFIGPCSKNPIFKTQVLDDFANVGELTVAILTQFDIPFKGTEEGINSIFNTPTGNDAIEIISDVEMRAYGWCYSVDGLSPEVYPHEIPVSSKTKSIVWHYGFARYYQGQWVTQCTPAYIVRPSSLCRN